MDGKEPYVEISDYSVMANPCKSNLGTPLAAKDRRRPGLHCKFHGPGEVWECVGQCFKWKSHKGQSQLIRNKAPGSMRELSAPCAPQPQKHECFTEGKGGGFSNEFSYLCFLDISNYKFTHLASAVYFF